MIRTLVALELIRLFPISKKTENKKGVIMNILIGDLCNARNQ